MRDKHLIIAIDFDGTIVKHEFPKIGEIIWEAFAWMSKFQEKGAKLILYTMRDGKYLDAALKLCSDNGIEFWAANDNPNQKTWTNSRKIYANVYIDDNAIGVPLKNDGAGRDYVDWDIVGPMVMKVIKEKYV